MVTVYELRRFGLVIVTGAIAMGTLDLPATAQMPQAEPARPQTEQPRTAPQRNSPALKPGTRQRAPDIRDEYLPECPAFTDKPLQLLV